VPWSQFLAAVEALPEGQLWRHNEAGDLPGRGDDIDLEKLRQLVEANRGKLGFTYTHKPLNARNAKAIRWANKNGFTVNLSADSVAEADSLRALNVGPVVLVVPEDQRRAFKTPAGNWTVICPNSLNPKVTCNSCRLCQRSDRKPIIAFPVHGSGKKHFPEEE
jgi:hypothetical protein